MSLFSDEICIELFIIKKETILYKGTEIVSILQFKSHWFHKNIPEVHFAQ